MAILDYDRIKNRTPAQLDAENAWWARRSEGEKRELLDRWKKEDNDREALRLFIGTVCVVVFAIVAFVPAIVMLGRLLRGD